MVARLTSPRFLALQVQMKTPLAILLLCAAGLYLIPSELLALDSNRRISQYAHTAWRLQDGYLDGSPNAITQTSDGYIWIGTQNGLFRFDGVRFVPWIAPTGSKLSFPSINTLAPADDGGLWIGTKQGLAYWRGDRLINYLPAGLINQIVSDGKHNVWIARSQFVDSDGPVCRVTVENLECYGASAGLAVSHAGPLAIDALGNMWVGSTDEMTRWSTGSSQTYPFQALRSARDLSGIESVAIAPDNSVWVGIDKSGAGLGLQHLSDGKFQTFRTPSFDGSRHKIAVLFIDRDGVLWVGTIDEGVFRVDHDLVDHFGGADGLSGDSVTCLTQDHEGNIWVATTKGIDNFRDLPVATFSKQQGLASDEAASITATSDGALWIGNLDSLDVLRNGTASSIRLGQGLPGQQVTSLFVDHSNVVWVGVDDGLYRIVNGRFLPVSRTHSPPVGIIESLAEDQHHDIWASVTRQTALRVLLITDGKIQREWSDEGKVGIVFAGPGGDPWISIVPGTLAKFAEGRITPRYALDNKEDFGRLYSPFLDDDGVIWASSRKGEVALKGGVFHVLTESSGLPCNWIYASLTDRIGSLWLYAQCGLIRIEKAELGRWLSTSDSRVAVQTFDVYAGAQPALATFKPRGTVSLDGRVWFVNDNLVQMIDPAHLGLNPLPPPVLVEYLTAGDKNYRHMEHPVLPPHTKDIEIDYTALSFVAPQRVQFRVRLIGHNEQWMDVGTRRSAFYTNLAPGSYQFLVTASNNAGVWNHKGATFEFSIAPAWYQTWWFRILCGMAVLLAAYSLYVVRLRQLSARIRMRLDARLEERTRIARDLHDTLLQTIQGSKLIADVAKENSTDTVKVNSSLNTLSAWLGRAAMEGRTALESLRATDAADLGTALRSVSEEYNALGAMEVSLSIDEVQREMNPVIRDEVFWIAYEAIRNASRHSQASRVDVGLAIADQLTLIVKDNGVGIPHEALIKGKAGHFGLQGMRERASKIGGLLTISSAPTSGTQIRLLVPGKIIFGSAKKTRRGSPP